MTRKGFSLIEIMVTLAIMAIASGFVAYSFVSMQDSARLTAAASTLKTVFQLARQSAVTYSSARRVVIETRSAEQGGFYPGPPVVSLWIEKKFVENDKYWNLDGTDTTSPPNYRRVDETGENTRLPRGTVVVEVNGRRVFDPYGTGQGQEAYYDISNKSPGVQRFYVVFNEKGNVETWYAYTDRLLVESYEELAALQGDSYDNLGFHVADINTEFDMNFDGTPDTSYVTDIPLTNSLQAEDLPDPHPLEFLAFQQSRPAEVMAQRQMVATVFLLSMTGRAMMFEYGRWEPFDSGELTETDTVQ